MALTYNEAAAKQIHNRLICEGMTEAGAAGTMANIYAESGFCANNLQNSYEKKLGMTDEGYTAAVDSGTYGNFVHDSAGYGLCQWTYWSRKQGLLEYARSCSKSIGDIDMQADYMLQEIKSKKALYNMLCSSENPAECARAVMLQYERPADQSEKNVERREGYAKELYTTFSASEPIKREDKTMGKTIIIAIDAGHGMKTAGKRCLKSIDPNETREWWLNDRIADMLEAKLAAYNCRVLRVGDTTGAKDVPLATRVKTANTAKADVYISIHHNAGLNGRNGGGTVVYYYSAATERPKQAQALYDELTTWTGLTGNRSGKVIKKGYYVIKKTAAPAFLIENGFMDSPDDVPVILSTEHANKTAHGILCFLIKQFGLQWKQGIQEDNTEKQLQAAESKTIYYPAYTGKKTTLTAAMTSLGINSTYSHRKQIATANGITGYMGTAAQNTQIYNLLVAGLLQAA